jgi:O-antigen/teichoic acid export membrane protein
MRLRNTILTGAASYVQMGSLALTQLASIPLALHFLDEERFGLWAFVFQSLGYLLLLDFGVSASLGRLLADPIHNGDEKTWNGWFNLVLVVLALQALLILGLGLVLVDPLLRWFEIKPSLIPEARHLWLMVLVLTVITFPMRVFSGIVGAQNRSYWATIGMSAGLWIGLLVFYVFLRAGWGSIAYGYSAGTQMILTAAVPLIAVMRGPNRFSVRLQNLPWGHIRELFGFSSSIFLAGITVQIVFYSQSMVITKILGLGAVASFAVSSRVPLLLMQLLWRPYDAFLPRWQIFWTKGQMDPLADELWRVFRLTMGMCGFAVVCSLAMNRWFVLIFGKESLYAGKTFDLFFALFVLVQVWSHCLLWCFILSKRLKGYTIAVVLDGAASIVVAILGTIWFGLTGYIAFTALYGLVGIATWYATLKAPPIFGGGIGRLGRTGALNLVFNMLLLAIAFFAFERIPSEYLFALEAMVACAAAALFVVTFKTTWY